MSVHAVRRVTFVVALLTMVGAGRWLLSADVPQVAANTWASTGALGNVPDGAASATLIDGRMVVAGGRNEDGTFVSQVGIFDPASQSWEDGGQLVTARTGHSATALGDGRVLFAGGRTANGVSPDVEIYNPNTRQSVHVGDMWLQRVNHAAAELKNGLVLIVGGSDGAVVLDYVELFDPQSGQTQSLITRLGVARERLTATTLLDGHVLIAGGKNDGGNVATAELFDSGSQTVFETGSLHAARSGHVAVLLPNNNQVLIAGGIVNGAPSASAELYADWRDGFRVVPNPMSEARTGAIAGALPQHNLAFVGRGGSATGEFFGYATVKTDRADYWPGETVTITGSGWQPGETVTLKISEDADTHNDFNYTAVADAQGNIVNAEFAPIENEVFHHFGMRFYLTATGAASTALNTFTDGNATFTGTVRNSVTNAPIANATVTCTDGCNGKPSPAVTNAAGVYTLAITYPGDGATLELTAAAAGFSAPQIQDVTVTNNQSYTVNFSLVPNTRPTTTAVSCVANPTVVNGPTTCTATVSDVGTGTAAAPAGSVSFATTGAGTFSAPSCTLSGSSSPTSCGVTYTPTGRGTGTHAITGTYSPTSSHSGSSNTPGFNLTVNKAPQAALLLSTPATLVYGTTGNASATQGSGTGVVTYSAGASTGCSVNATTGAITVTNASRTCVITAEKAADDDYLAATAGPNTVALEKADATVVVEGYSGVFDGNVHGASGTAIGIAGADLGTQLNLGNSFTNVPGGTANWVFSGGDNYLDESGSVEIAISKANAMVTVNGYTGTYDAVPHGATGSAIGVGGAVLPGLNLGSTFTDFPGGTALWTFSGGTNYFDQSGSVQIVINKADASVAVSGYSGTYDGAAHGATGSATGVGGVDLSSQLDLGESFADAPGGTSHWTFNGGINYLNESGTVPIVIEKADATVTVNGYTGAYDGASHGASGSASGVGGVDLSGQLNLGSTYTDVPGGIAHWTFTGGTNYNDQSGDVAIVIEKANATVTVNGYTGTYDGASHAASGSASGVGAVDLSSQLDLGGTFTDVPGGTAHWTFTGGTNYNDQSGDVAIVIEQANATIVVTPYDVVYDAAAHTSSGTATGVGGVDLSSLLDLSGTTHTDAGDYPYDAWTFAGNTNYKTASGTAANKIGRATPTIAITWNDSTYNANPNAATAVVNGVPGQVNLTPVAALVYYAGQAVSGSPLSGAPVNAGTYTVKAIFAGNSNYVENDAVKTITIHKATPVITWSNPADITYPAALSGTQLNATANVAGTFVYTPSSGMLLDAGSHTLKADFTPTDTNNYNPATKSVSITVQKGNQVITFGALANKTFGDAPVGISATGGASGQPVTFSTTTPYVCSVAPAGANAATVTILAVGSCTIRASQAGTMNYHAADDVYQGFSVAAWTTRGFHEPVGIPNSFFAPAGTDLQAGPTGAAWNSAKGGQTIPLKFNVFAAGIERTNTADIIGFAARPLQACNATTYEAPLDEFETAGATVLRYDGVAGSGQFIQNWKTPATRTEQCFRVELTLRDRSVLYTFVKLKK